MNIFSALGTLFNDIICYPLGAIMKLFYLITPNYAVLLILFTVVVRLCLFPLAVKQQRSTAETLRLQPKIQKLQKKYGKDQQKLQEEMSKLYAEEGVNPLGGCLPLVIQLPILYGLFQVVYNPLKYLMWFSQDTIDKIASVLRTYVNTKFNVYNFNDPKIQLYLAKAMKDNPDKVAFLGNYKNIDFTLFGIDLSATPRLAFDILILIPILVYITQALSSYLSFKMNKAMQQQQKGAAMNNILMTFLLPLMSVWISLTLPAAVGFYWIINSLLVCVQVIILNKFFSLDKLALQAEAESEKRKEAIRNGTAKPSRIQQMTQRALEMQKQQQAQGAAGAAKGAASKETPSKDTPSQANKDTEQKVKLNSKGKKSRSQIKEEQRRRLAESRKKSQDL